MPQERFHARMTNGARREGFRDRDADTRSSRTARRRRSKEKVSRHIPATHGYLRTRETAGDWPSLRPFESSKVRSSPRNIRGSVLTRGELWLSCKVPPGSALPRIETPAVRQASRLDGLRQTACRGRGSRERLRC